jgi:hypothetical protein
MSTTVDVYFVDAIHSQEFEGVFDERGVGEWEKTLGRWCQLEYGEQSSIQGLSLLASRLKRVCIYPGTSRREPGKHIVSSRCAKPIPRDVTYNRLENILALALGAARLGGLLALSLVRHVVDTMNAA